MDPAGESKAGCLQTDAHTCEMPPLVGWGVLNVCSEQYCLSIGGVSCVHCWQVQEVVTGKRNRWKKDSSEAHSGQCSKSMVFKTFSPNPFSFLFWLHLWHMDVLGPGIKSEPPLWPEPQPSKTGPLTHSAGPGIEHIPLQRQCWVLNLQCCSGNSLKSFLSIKLSQKCLSWEKGGGEYCLLMKHFPQVFIWCIIALTVFIFPQFSFYWLSDFPAPGLHHVEADLLIYLHSTMWYHIPTIGNVQWEGLILLPDFPDTSGRLILQRLWSIKWARKDRLQNRIENNKVELLSKGNKVGNCSIKKSKLPIQFLSESIWQQEQCVGRGERHFSLYLNI